MIKIFNSDDIDFSSNGNIAINPLSCIETKKKSLNGWYIEVEIPIKYKDYIVQDKLCVVKTKSKINPQAFSICDISYTSKKVYFKAEHIAFRARDYFLLDCRPISLNGSGALNYINERTDNISPFTIISDVETISTAYFIRKNLLEAWATIEERWGGTFEFDNYDVYFKQNIGNDNGEIVSYRKNLQDFRIYEDWSNVVTKLYPTGYDGIMLPETFLESDIQYDKHYTKTVSFETNLEDEEKTEDNLLVELRENANAYILDNKYPKVCYEITSNIVQSVDIGDIIHVKHPLVELSTEVQEYDYDLLTKKITKLIFGNYNRDVKTKFDNIKKNLSNIVNKVSQQSVDIDKQTERINNLNKNGIVYIDDNEILILDSIPKETAVDVLKIGLGGLGISENGIDGPFVSAITGKGINADCISSGLVKTDRIEGYSQLITTVSNLGEQQEEQQKQITQTIMDLNGIRNLFQITGGTNLIKNSVGLFDDNYWSQSETGTFYFGEDNDLIGTTTSSSKISISNGTLVSTATNIGGLTIDTVKSFNFKIKQDADVTTVVTLYGVSKSTPLYSRTFTGQLDWQDIYNENDCRFFIDSTDLTLEIESTSTYDGCVQISDLMLNDGEKTQWQPANGEVWGTVIKMSQQGISCYSHEGGYITMQTSQGFQIRELHGSDIGDIISKFTNLGIETIEITQSGKHTQKNLVHDVITSGGNDIYIEYVKG